ncbi:MAG: hypothetical protein H6Q15_2011 [Bacteroidetes bacterium]|nr:hypothetical protein [Bacteroidota bacterium]
MKEFTKIINKYAILLLIPELFNLAWNILITQIYGNIDNKFLINFRENIFLDFNQYMFSIPSYLSIIFNLIIIGYLIYDFRKHELKNLIITLIATYFFPILGILSFSILYFFKQIEQKN